MRLLAFALLSCLASFVHASEEAMQRFSYLMADDSRRQQAYAAGQERALFCSYCHGETGNSKREHIPNLAAQNPLYLFQAFEKFASGQRTDFVMSKLAQNLTLEDRVNIAVYFSQQRVNPPTNAANEPLRKQGEVLFKTTCTGCHGNHAEGMETMPRLAGQPAAYLLKALTRFRENDPSRAGSVMIQIAGKLSAADVGALAAYLSQLQLTPAEEMASVAKLREVAAH